MFRGRTSWRRCAASKTNGRVMKRDFLQRTYPRKPAIRCLNRGGLHSSNLPHGNCRNVLKRDKWSVSNFLVSVRHAIRSKDPIYFPTDYRVQYPCAYNQPDDLMFMPANCRITLAPRNTFRLLLHVQLPDPLLKRHRTAVPFLQSGVIEQLMPQGDTKDQNRTIRERPRRQRKRQS